MLIAAGTLQGDYFVVCVLDPHEFSEGKIVPGSAFAEFRVREYDLMREQEADGTRFIIEPSSGNHSKAR